jgi:cytosine/adenosine deaminase-related metal-dependent hydrolase
MANSLVITNVRPMGAPPTSIAIENGKITAIGPNAKGAETIDGGGAIALPGLVEAHTHLDKTLLGMGWHKHQAGPKLMDKIENERKLKKTLGIDAARQSARQVVLSISKGTTHTRTHIDVDTECGVSSIEGMMATREKYRDVMDIEIVAFPQSGLLTRQGTVQLMDEALSLGAEVVGGLDPCAIDRDPKGHVDAIFGLAQKHGKPLDIHLHEPGEMGLFSFDLIIERTLAMGMQGKVTVSHAFSLGTPDRDLVDPVLDAIAKAGIAIMTTGPASRPAPPVKKLRERGIVVCSGNDGIRDTWGPYGNADMLERAMFIGLRNNFRHDEDVEMALEACTQGGAAVMGLKNYGLAVGKDADLVLVDGESVTDTVANRPARRLVVKRGRVVAKDGRALVTAP